MWNCDRNGNDVCDNCEWYRETPIKIDGKVVAVEVKCTNPEICTKHKKI